uniref:Uncharacterized protein n=1 Tax=Glossina pallidipes TaxID=7398 RepID=A0A1B0A4B4_GLOPL
MANSRKIDGYQKAVHSQIQIEKRSGGVDSEYYSNRKYLYPVGSIKFLLPCITKGGENGGELESRDLIAAIITAFFDCVQQLIHRVGSFSIDVTFAALSGYFGIKLISKDLVCRTAKLISECEGLLFFLTNL